MGIADIELLLSKTINSKTLVSPSVENRKRQSEMMKQQARDGIPNNNKGGWNHTSETRQQMTASQKKVWDNNTERKAAVSKRARAMAKPFHTPFGVFSSVREASEVLGIKYATLYSRLYSMSDRYYLRSAT
jgi:hypothetical protein